jgi:hypothetical protein
MTNFALRFNLRKRALIILGYYFHTYKILTSDENVSSLSNFAFFTYYKSSQA